MTTYKAIFGSDSTVEYSFDGAKAWVAQMAGRTMRWAVASDGHCWYGYRSASEKSIGGATGDGSIARIVSHTHPDF